ncbi:hypothetical protein AS54_5621 (plasmid) [Bacillus cereus 03BB102]|uniref:Uncharacterized protein n=1 Tax=Bacillus cereus (strain 03BB102) TaxID=572264 RepID=A0A125YA04_BACC3|nr:conserved hypothetical protein [Bacillus cereus 03BB102]AJG51326.1 hypothetical protein AS54_5621 [Bacillus cereus 03BB102]
MKKAWRQYARIVRNVPFRELYNDYPKWIQFCLCCNYREVNTLESPFVY